MKYNEIKINKIIVEKLKSIDLKSLIDTIPQSSNGLTKLRPAQEAIRQIQDLIYGMLARCQCGYESRDIPTFVQHIKSPHNGNTFVQYTKGDK